MTGRLFQNRAGQICIHDISQRSTTQFRLRKIVGPSPLHFELICNGRGPATAAAGGRGRGQETHRPGRARRRSMAAKWRTAGIPPHGGSRRGAYNSSQGFLGPFLLRLGPLDGTGGAGKEGSALSMDSRSSEGSCKVVRVCVQGGEALQNGFILDPC